MILTMPNGMHWMLLRLAEKPVLGLPRAIGQRTIDFDACDNQGGAFLYRAKKTMF